MKLNTIVVILAALLILSCKQKSVDKTESSEVRALITSDTYLRLDSIIQKNNVSNHVRIYEQANNNGKYVTIIPSLGRDVDDYTEMYNSTITSKLVNVGYKVVLIQPRGIGKSTGDLTPENVQLKELANDIKTTIDALGITRLHVVGHAFGNRVARTFATMHEEYVDKLALLACGGNFEMDPKAIRCLKGSFDSKLSDNERLKMIECAFFAKGNDASVWLNGWYPKLAAAQIHAATNIDGNYYKRAGGKPFLVIQATDDFIAPADKAGKVLKEELGEQVTYIEIENAGHALTTEQPDEVAKALIEYFSK